METDENTISLRLEFVCFPERAYIRLAVNKLLRDLASEVELAAS
jgi:hypothetical protein